MLKSTDKLKHKVTKARVPNVQVRTFITEYKYPSIDKSVIKSKDVIILERWTH